jgi:hypothetical protein
VAQRKTGNPTWLNSTMSNTGNSGLTEFLGALLPRGGAGLTDTLSAVSRSIETLMPASQQQAQALLANTQAIIQNTTAHSSSSTADTIGKITSTFTGGLLGLSPILSGLLGLFGGGSSSAPPPLVSYWAPPSIGFEGANIPGSSSRQVDYNQSGRPRVMGPPSQSSPQITVQVQAMDSRSFMDHSQDIANAVRDAMLNMNSLNDVISDL